MGVHEPLLLSCPQGHRWDRPEGLSGQRVLCPECGLEMRGTAAGEGEELATRPPPDTHEPAAAQDPPDPIGGSEPLSTPQRGRFRIIKPHAQGGLGRVSVARDEELGREVALKEIRPELCEHPASRQRFVNEAQITGQLEHPNIVPVYALGRDEVGRPYYAMRFVRGRTLHKAIREYHERPEPQALRDLLRRFVDVCHAIAYAHSQGIIHRDLKPSNVMLGDYGQTLVVDWGIAKRVAEAGHPPTPLEPGTSEPGLAAVALPEMTLAGQQLGTGAFMAPEQAQNAAAAGPAADVFSLGAMLLDVVRGRVVASPHAVSEPLPPALRPLAAVAQRAMAGAPTERYGSASELADEVERFLANEPVRAYRDPWTRRAGRWARRHKPLVAAAVALLMTTVVALAVSNVFISRQRDAKHAALRDREAALAAEQQARAEATRHARTAEERQLASMMASGDAYAAAGRSQDARDVFVQSWELTRRLQLPEVAVIASLVRTNAEAPPALIGGDAGGFSGHRAGINVYCVSSDSRFVFTAGADAEIRQWDLRTGRTIRTFRGHEKNVKRIGLSPDDRWLASHGSDRMLRLWDTRTGREIWAMRLNVTSFWMPPMFSSDGTRLAYYWDRRRIRIWEVSSGRQVSELVIATEAEEASGLTASSVAFSPDGAHLLVGRGNNIDAHETPRLFDLATGSEVRRFEGTAGNVFDLEFLPGGHTLVSKTRTRAIIWDYVSGRERHVFPADNWEEDITVLDDGRTIAIAGGSGEINVFDIATGARKRQLRRTASARYNSTEFSLARDASIAVAKTLGRRDSLVLIDMRESAEITQLLGHTDSVMSVAVAADGRTAVSGSWDGTLRRWDLATGKPLALMSGTGGRIWAVAISPDARSIVAGSDGDNTLRLWDLVECREVRRWTGHTNIVTGVAFSPDGRTVASSSSDGTVRLWAAETGQEVHVFRGHREKVRSVAFTPDGQTILSAGFDETLRAWNARTGATEKTFTVRRYSEAEFPWRTGLAISPDGQFAMTAGYTGEVALVDLDGPETVQAMPAHHVAAWGVACFPDGKTTVSYAEDGMLMFWDVVTRRSIGSVRVEAGVGKCVAISPDGTHVILGGGGGALRVIDLSRPHRYRDFQTQLEQARQRLDADAKDAWAMKAFGDWYAFRGRHDWAVDFYEQARAGGADVSPLELGRCYWQLDRFDDARRELNGALERGEAPADYLRLCLRAIERGGKS